MSVFYLLASLAGLLPWYVYTLLHQDVATQWWTRHTVATQSMSCGCAAGYPHGLRRHPDRAGVVHAETMDRLYPMPFGPKELSGPEAG